MPDASKPLPQRFQADEELEMIHKLKGALKEEFEWHSKGVRPSDTPAEIAKAYADLLRLQIDVEARRLSRGQTI